LEITSFTDHLFYHSPSINIPSNEKLELPNVS
jgi:hypothetical protein